MIRKQTHDQAVAVTFVLPATHPCAPVSVVGDFNEWQPHRHPMISRPDGTMSTTVLCPLGSSIRFRYLGSGGNWFDDPDADHIDQDGCVVNV